MVLKAEHVRSLGGIACIIKCLTGKLEDKRFIPKFLFCFFKKKKSNLGIVVCAIIVVYNIILLLERQR